MNKTVHSGDIVNSDMGIIAIAVTVNGESIPKILRERKGCLADYKDILHRSRSVEDVRGWCVPLYDEDERCIALMFTKGEAEDAERKAVKQLDYFANVTASGVAYRSGDFDSNIIDNGLTCRIEEWE